MAGAHVEVAKEDQGQGDAAVRAVYIAASTPQARAASHRSHVCFEHIAQVPVRTLPSRCPVLPALVPSLRMAMRQYAVQRPRFHALSISAARTCQALCARAVRGACARNDRLDLRCVAGGRARAGAGAPRGARCAGA
eukprot:990148-Pleurochrysis_carterae.AAC.3